MGLPGLCRVMPFVLQLLLLCLACTPLLHCGCVHHVHGCLAVGVVVFSPAPGVELDYGANAVCHHRHLHCFQQAAAEHDTQVAAGGVHR